MDTDIHDDILFLKGLDSCDLFAFLRHSSDIVNFTFCFTTACHYEFALAFSKSTRPALLDKKLKGGFLLVDVVGGGLRKILRFI